VVFRPRDHKAQFASDAYISRTFMSSCFRSRSGAASTQPVSRRSFCGPGQAGAHRALAGG